MKKISYVFILEMAGALLAIMLPVLLSAVGPDVATKIKLLVLGSVGLVAVASIAHAYNMAGGAN